MKFLVKQTLLALFLIGLGVGASFAQKTSGYHFLNKIDIGGDGGWDYLTVDPESKRLYVSHATHVVVIDTSTDKIVGDIPNTNGVHGIAFDEKLGKGFISDGRDNNVMIFDLKTYKPLGTVPTGKNPDSIIYDPGSKRVFAFNGGSSNVTAIDAADGKVAGTIDLGGKPEFAVADGKGTVFVNIEDRNEIIAFDSIKLAIKAHWPIAPGEEASGLAFDVKNMRLFAVCGNKKMIVMDATNGKIVADLPTGGGTDAAGFDPETKMAFASNGDGTLTVIHEDSRDKFTVVENVKTDPRSRTMALDTNTHKIYLPTAKFGEAPAPTAAQPRPRAPMVPNSFMVVVYGK